MYLHLKTIKTFGIGHTSLIERKRCEHATLVNELNAVDDSTANISRSRNVLRNTLEVHVIGFKSKNILHLKFAGKWMSLIVNGTKVCLVGRKIGSVISFFDMAFIDTLTLFLLVQDP